MTIEQPEPGGVTERRSCARSACGDPA
jgi:hypothetical protein